VHERNESPSPTVYLSLTHTHTDEAVSLPVAAANVSKTTLVERL